MLDDVCTLIRYKIQQNDRGIEHRAETRREIFCRVSSVKRAEYFSAGQDGLRPEYMFTAAAIEYDNEKLLEYNGEMLAIYRTYLNGDAIELYTKRETGVAAHDRQLRENNSDDS